MISVHYEYPTSSLFIVTKPASSLDTGHAVSQSVSYFTVSTGFYMGISQPHSPQQSKHTFAFLHSTSSSNAFPSSSSRSSSNVFKPRVVPLKGDLRRLSIVCAGLTARRVPRRRWGAASRAWPTPLSSAPQAQPRTCEERRDDVGQKDIEGEFHLSPRTPVSGLPPAAASQLAPSASFAISTTSFATSVPTCPSESRPCRPCPLARGPSKTRPSAQHRSCPSAHLPWRPASRRPAFLRRGLCWPSHRP